MNFIDPQLLPLVTLDKSYHPYLVALSVFIAIISSFTAFGTSERIQASSSRLQQALWIAFGAASMGIGIWSMHIIGSLALILPIPILYNHNITLLSVLPVVLASGVVFWLMNQASFDLKKLVFCGVVLATGIGIMHYSCMEAIELNANKRYIKSLFIFSVLVAVILSIIAIKIQKDVTQQDRGEFFNKKQSLSALVMGLAISGMHYTAMQAVVFVPRDNVSQVFLGIDAALFFAIISLVVLLFLTLALTIPHMLRYRQMAHTLQKNSDDLKIAATAFQTQEAIMVTDINMKIIRVNDAFTRITGYTEAYVLGKTPQILKSGKHDESFYKDFWNDIIKEGKWSGEIWDKRKNGEVFPVWQTVSTVIDEKDNTTHYVSFISDITDYKKAIKEIEKLAFYDTLTELPNRRLLKDRLEHELNVARRYQRAGILFFLDLDRFKQINDSLGHSIGDQLLIEIAYRLQSLLRDTDMAVRLGGDEFIILVGAQDGIGSDLLEQSTIIAEKIITAINTPYLIGEHRLYISTSIGITLYTGIDEDVEMLLKRADSAMYQAKKGGRNTFRFYQQSIQETVDTKLQIERNLYVAIVEDELNLHYQPQLADNNDIIGAEALIRWKSSTLGTISPAEFIPVAEDSGLIITIGQWVIETVCEQINLWDKQNIHIPHVAVNISAKQFHQPDFVPMILDTVLESQVKPERIMLEITEGVFLGNIEEAIDKMHALKKNGFSFSIDDFGTGYSSLTYLKRLPFDQLKIDQSFVNGLLDSPADVAIIKAIVLIAKSMDLNLIAEGVETDLHLAYLSGFGCHNYQGYLFSKPLPAKQLAEFIRQH